MRGSMPNSQLPSQYLKGSMEIGWLVLFSFLSGTLWMVIARGLFSDSFGRKFFSSAHGRTLIGLIWFAITLTVVYSVEFRDRTFKCQQIVESLPPALIMGMLFQLVAFALLSYFGDEQ